MSGKGGKRSKVQVHGAKPELPPFLQAMRQQIVANEDTERKERSLRKRKESSKSGAGSSRRRGEEEDDPTVVKLGDNDLTEEEYKRMKRDLETQYKLDQDSAKDDATGGHADLDIDKMIEQRKSSTKDMPSKSSHGSDKADSKSSGDRLRTKKQSSVIKSNKELSYDSSD